MGAAGSSAAPHPALAPGEGALLSAALAKHAPGLPPAWGVLPAPALARVRAGLGERVTDQVRPATRNLRPSIPSPPSRPWTCQNLGKLRPQNYPNIFALS